MSKLASEIKARGLKFADVVDGKYEMLSGDEIEMICKALNKTTRKPRPQTPARIEHAWRLRQEGLNYRSIGDRLGVVNERARTMVKQHLDAMAGRDEAGIIPPGDVKIDRRPSKWWKTR